MDYHLVIGNFITCLGIRAPNESCVMARHIKQQMPRSGYIVNILIIKYRLAGHDAKGAMNDLKVHWP